MPKVFCSALTFARLKQLMLVVDDGDPAVLTEMKGLLALSEMDYGAEDFNLLLVRIVPTELVVVDWR